MGIITYYISVNFLIILLILFSGNILVKRLSKANIYVKNTLEENAVRLTAICTRSAPPRIQTTANYCLLTQVSNDILKLPNGQLELEKPFKLFDMKKFQQNVNRELKRQYPERHKLETQVCVHTN